jgi:CDP-glucose 4,6-dehydratase
VGQRERTVEGVVLISDYWDGRRVLVTGHTGFKGAWLTTWLEALGADVVGLALPPHGEPNLWDLLARSLRIREYRGDIRDAALVGHAFAGTGPQVVLHLAAQSLVRRGYDDPAGTFDVNIRGTVNVLEAARRCPTVEAVVVVTSDKVYAPGGDDGRPHGESSALGGRDPYSASKACCELVVDAYRKSFFDPAGVAVATARAGNVIGGGDWAPDRVVPDTVRMLWAGAPVPLRYPDATRPWQHVLDPLHGYLVLAERMAVDGAGVPRALNFGPPLSSCIPVRDLVERLSECWGGRPGWRPDPAPASPERATLTLSSSLATDALGWHPVLDVDQAVAWTAEWYGAHRRGDDVVSLTGAQIERYRQLAR